MLKTLSTEAAARMVGVSSNTLRALVASGRFILPVQLTDRRIAFIESEVSDWIINRPRGFVTKNHQI